MFCSKCGEILRDTALRCPVCGAVQRKSGTQVNTECDCKTNRRVSFGANRPKTHSTFTSDRPSAGSGSRGEPGVREFGRLIRDFFRRGLDFRGRSSRWEFWWTCLFVFLVTVVLADMLTACLIWFLVMLVPFNALSVRRLHDLGMSGWWLLVKLIPLVGVVLLTVLFCMPSSSRQGYRPVR